MCKGKMHVGPGEIDERMGRCGDCIVLWHDDDFSVAVRVITLDTWLYMQSGGDSCHSLVMGRFQIVSIDAMSVIPYQFHPHQSVLSQPWTGNLHTTWCVPSHKTSWNAQWWHPMDVPTRRMRSDSG